MFYKNVYIVTNGVEMNGKPAQVTVITDSEEKARRLASNAFREVLDLYTFYMECTLNVTLIQEKMVLVTKSDFVSEVLL